jgi:hypothetical protein
MKQTVMKIDQQLPTVDTSFFAEIVKFSLFLVSVSVFTYLLFSQVIMAFFPDIINIDPDLREKKLLVLLLLTGLVSGGTGLLISVKQKQLRLVSPFEISKEFLFSYALIAYFFAQFITERFTLFLAILLFFFLPQLTQFYTCFSPLRIKKLPFKKINSASLKREFMVIATVVSLVAVTTWGGFKVVEYLRFRVLYQVNLQKSLYIAQLNPKNTTQLYPNEVIGYNFGWHETSKYHLMSNKGELKTDNWTDTKVTFTTPSDLDSDTLTLWVEKPIHEGTQLEKSNEVTLKILPRQDVYPTVDDSKLTKAFKKIKRIFLLNRDFELKN